jgi:signal transduction histidine kinase
LGFTGLVILALAAITLVSRFSRNSENSAGKTKNHEPIMVYGQALDSLFTKMQSLVYANPDSARVLATEAMLVSAKHGHTDWQIRMLNLIGVSFAMQSEYIIARKYYHDALSLAIQTNNLTRKGDTYNNIGGVNFLTTNYPDAIQNYLEAIHNYELAEEYGKVPGIHSNIGNLYAELNNTDKALSHYRIALDEFLKQNNTNGISMILGLLANSSQKQNKPDSAMIFVNRAIEVSLKDSNLFNLSNAYRIKADILLSQKKIKEAGEYYEKSYTISEIFGNKNIQSKIFLGRAAACLALSDFNMALNYSRKSLALANSQDDLKTQLSALESLSRIYGNAGDPKQSLAYGKMAEEIRLKLTDQSKIHQIYNLEIIRLSKDKEIQRFDLEKNKMTLEKRNSTIFIITLLSITLIVSLFLIFSRIRHIQEVKINEALLTLSEERAQASFNAELQERKHLGLELHDGVGPLLSLAKLNISALIEKPALSQERKLGIMQNTLSTLDELLRVTKQISHNMAPMVLIESGLKSAIIDLVARLNETEKYKVSLDISGLHDTTGSYLEHTLYRCILETFNNILLHADGSEINLQIIQNHEDITVMIEDNGKGFDVRNTENKAGLGLKSIPGRIESLGGKMYIDSMPGRGTIVTIVVPVIKTNETWKK